MKKIESVIESCHKCRHMVRLQEVDGNTFFVAVCDYGNNVKAHPLTALASSTGKDLFNNPIKIPENCPLENYYPVQQ